MQSGKEDTPNGLTDLQQRAIWQESKRRWYHIWPALDIPKEAEVRHFQVYTRALVGRHKKCVITDNLHAGSAMRYRKTIQNNNDNILAFPISYLSRITRQVYLNTSQTDIPKRNNTRSDRQFLYYEVFVRLPHRRDSGDQTKNN